MRFKLALLMLFMAVLSGCTPALRTDQPLVFDADYETLFDATLQAVAATYVREPFGELGRERRRFRVVEADRDSGLITAASGRVSTSFLSARKTFADDSSDFTIGLRFDLPPGPVPEHTLTLVLRPAGEGRASLVFSTSTYTGVESRVGNRFMARVVDALEDRFGAVDRQPR